MISRNASCPRVRIQRLCPASGKGFSIAPFSTAQLRSALAKLQSPQTEGLAYAPATLIAPNRQHVSDDGPVWVSGCSVQRKNVASALRCTQEGLFSLADNS